MLRGHLVESVEQWKNLFTLHPFTGEPAWCVATKMEFVDHPLVQGGSLESPRGQVEDDGNGVLLIVLSPFEQIAGEFKE